MHNSYIIRVYRQEKDDPHMLVGTVEKVEEKDKLSFTNYDELWQILNCEENNKITRSIKSNDRKRRSV